MTHETQMDETLSETRRLDKRLQDVAWAMFLILTGALWLVPASRAPEGTWLAGFGLILLALNAARGLYRLRVDGFGAVVGGVALVAGAGRILGREVPFLPALLIALGLAMTLRLVTRAWTSDRTVSPSTGA